MEFPSPDRVSPPGSVRGQHRNDTRTTYREKSSARAFGLSGTRSPTNYRIGQTRTRYQRDSGACRNQVMDEGPNPKRKYPLHRRMKGVLIRNSNHRGKGKTAEPSPVRILYHWLPICNRLRTRPGRVEPEIYFSVSERALRPIEPITDCRDQLREFYKFSV